MLILTSGRNVKFGAHIRVGLEESEFGMPEITKKIEVDPTGLSKVKQDKFLPPTEDKDSKIAEIFEVDIDELLAPAREISTYLSDIGRERLLGLAVLLPVTKGMTSDDVARIEFQLPFRLPSADIRLYRLALGS